MLNKYKLGDITEEYVEINLDNELDNVDYLQGINNKKYFQESNSNKNDINLLRYKICRNNTFAYNKATSRNNEKISIAYRTSGDCLVSPSYVTFKTINKNVVIDEYLMLWFKRPVFDKYVRFNSWGSATEFFTYSNFADTEIYLPSIEEQNKIVNIYNAIYNRIEIKKKLNNNLEAQAQALFTSWFVDFEPFEHPTDEEGHPLPPLEWKRGILNDCIDFLNGYAFKTDDLFDEPSSYCYDVFKMGNIKKGGGLNYNGTKSWIKQELCVGLDRFVARSGDVLMAMTDMKENVAILGNTALMDVDDKYIVNQRVGLLRPNGYLEISPYYIYLLTNNFSFLQELRRNAHIGVQVNLSKEDIVNSPIAYAPKEINCAFAHIVKPLFDCISINNAEILKLNEIALQIQNKLSY